MGVLTPATRDVMDQLETLAGDQSPGGVGELLWQLGLSRRQFLQLSVLSGVAVALAGCNAANRPVRRDISTLAANDPIIKAYEDAIVAMKALPSTDARSWSRQVGLHNTFCPHRNYLFLPWHRAYLRYFEDICRELSMKADFALPYWHWQNNHQIPAVFFNTASPLFIPGRVAGPTSTLSSSIFGASNIETILDQTNFLLFASSKVGAAVDQTTWIAMGPLESGPHNTVHNFVGGTMATGNSPGDPIFWTHHNVIDAIWVEWNIKRGNPNTNDPDWVNRKFAEFSDKDGNAVEVSVLATVLFPYFVYRFDDPVLGVP